MPTLDFALAPEPSRQQEVRFDASEIVRLWDADVDILRVGSSRLLARASQYRVAAMLPTQELDAEAFSALESDGVLVVEVPQSFREASNERIAEYLTSQLSDGHRETTARMAALGTSDLGLDGDGTADLRMNTEEEADFLEFVNDPANQLGGHL